MQPDARLTPELAARLARIALGHVGREYPNKLDHVLEGPEDAQPPRALHPIFYGSFDWHSCVHSYWLLARVYRRFPGGEAAREIAAQLDAAFTPGKVAGELAYLERPSARAFERPYGWAWLLTLASELAHHGAPEGRRWAAALQPLAEAFAERFKAFLPLADYPVRSGAHGNTAFALTFALDYGDRVGDSTLAALCRAKALAWYGDDADCQLWEPSGDDFLSPALTEAVCMSRALPGQAFRGWLTRFLPRLADQEPAALFQPVRVSDRSDGKIAHLDGLNLSRAWCWRTLAAEADRTLVDIMRATADRHLAASLPAVEGDYMGEHWLATYALLALDQGF